MIKGIGIDICKIDRINLNLVNKILTQNEFMIYDKFTNQQRKIEFLAGRFAAKEAVFKALSGTEFKLGLQTIEILNDSSGSPYVLRPEIEKHKIWISISHEKEYVVAQAILEYLGSGK